MEQIWFNRPRSLEKNSRHELSHDPPHDPTIWSRSHVILFSAVMIPRVFCVSVSIVCVSRSVSVTSGCYLHFWNLQNFSNQVTCFEVFFIWLVHVSIHRCWLTHTKPAKLGTQTDHWSAHRRASSQAVVSQQPGRNVPGTTGSKGSKDLSIIESI
jgi:hypothetical protein